MLFNQLCIQRLLCVVFNPRELDTCSKLLTTFALFFFSVLSLGDTHTQLRFFYPLSTIDGACVKEIPSSPYLHNFNVHILESGSLGTRLHKNYKFIPRFRKHQDMPNILRLQYSYYTAGYGTPTTPCFLFLWVSSYTGCTETMSGFVLVLQKEKWTFQTV